MDALLLLAIIFAPPLFYVLTHQPKETVRTSWKSQPRFRGKWTKSGGRILWSSDLKYLTAEQHMAIRNQKSLRRGVIYL